jgi:hypothetical protein
MASERDKMIAGNPCRVIRELGDAGPGELYSLDLSSLD